MSTLSWEVCKKTRCVKEERCRVDWTCGLGCLGGKVLG